MQGTAATNFQCVIQTSVDSEICSSSFSPKSIHCFVARLPLSGRMQHHFTHAQQFKTTRSTSPQNRLNKECFFSRKGILLLASCTTVEVNVHALLTCPLLVHTGAYGHLHNPGMGGSPFMPD
jgi:hypothetical protein